MASADCGELYIGNTINVHIEGLADSSKEEGDSDYYINDATCTFSLKDAAGVAVVDSQQDISMTYVAGSDGDYIGQLPYDAAMTNGTSYMVHIVATKAGIGVGDWRPVKQARYR